MWRRSLTFCKKGTDKLNPQPLSAELAYPWSELTPSSLPSPAAPSSMDLSRLPFALAFSPSLAIFLALFLSPPLRIKLRLLFIESQTAPKGIRRRNSASPTSPLIYLSLYWRLTFLVFMSYDLLNWPLFSSHQKRLWRKTESCSYAIQRWWRASKATSNNPPLNSFLAKGTTRDSKITDDNRQVIIQNYRGVMPTTSRLVARATAIVSMRNLWRVLLGWVMVWTHAAWFLHMSEDGAKGFVLFLRA